MKRLINVVLPIFLFLFCSSSFAKQNPLIPNSPLKNSNLSFSLGILQGESNEILYNQGVRLSQLDWKIKNLNILKMKYSWDPYRYLTFNANGWSSLTPGSGYMDDYDWLDANYPTFTEHSWHPDTKVNYGYEYDFNAQLWLIKNKTIQLSLLAGYQNTLFSWTAYGGYGSYRKGTINIIFPDTAVGGYNINMSVPYVGIEAGYRYKNLDINLLLKFSNKVKTNARDEHYLRGFYVSDETKNSNYYGTTMNVGYYLTNNLKLFTELTYSLYKNARGNATLTEYSTNESDSYDEGSYGMSSKHYDATIGILYQF